MKTDIRPAFQRTLEATLREVIRASDEHPDTKDAEVCRVKIAVTVTYEGTSTTTVCKSEMAP